MCGIVGYAGHRQAWPIILEGLQHLEYRGYDSVGIAILSPSGQLEVRKSVGKVRDLSSAQSNGVPQGQIGLGHTRWATHGKPTVENAHPHTDCKNQVAVAHNGIVENYLQLKNELTSKGHVFSSETDSEVIAHLIEDGVKTGLEFEAAFTNLRTQLEGSQAIVATRIGGPKVLLALRLGNAGGIVVAHRGGEVMISSDLPALVRFADQVSFLDNGEVAAVTGDGVTFIGLEGKAISKRSQPVSQSAAWVAKEGYKHFMLKEIMEQPRVVSNALSGRVNFDKGEIALEDFPLSEAEVKELRRIVLIGCGTSLHAAIVGRHFMEGIAGLAADVDSASEFRYRDFHIDEHTLVVSVGQSGETADTLAAMAAVREKGGRLVTICNVEGSQATRLAEGMLHMRSGMEIGVASTKTYIASIAVMYILSAYLGQIRETVNRDKSKNQIGEFARLPNLLGKLLSDHAPYETLAKKYHKYEDFLYLGRGLNYPTAIEGALKLKEISYIHAEGYPAGEMKHGPIALIDPNMPVVAIAPRSSFHAKMVNNVKEAKARDGLVIALVSEGDEELPPQVDDVLYIPECGELLSPFLAVVPLQLLAYYIAVRRGCDVDQPRNLAKSVTVE